MAVLGYVLQHNEVRQLGEEMDINGSSFANSRV